MDQPRSGTFLAHLDEEKSHPLVLNFDGEGTTIAVIKIDDLVGKGVSRCNPNDHYNEEIGIRLATVRSLIDICSQIEKIWTDRTRTKAELAAQRAAKKSRKSMT